MKNTIEVNGIRIYAHHGCLEEETNIGGHYIVDATIETNFLAAAKTDELSKTVDYVQVNRIVREEMNVPSKLIESVGMRVVERMQKEIKGIEKLQIKITKICPPINGDVENVAIVIET